MNWENIDWPTSGRGIFALKTEHPAIKQLKLRTNTGWSCTTFLTAVILYDDWGKLRSAIEEVPDDESLVWWGPQKHLSFVIMTNWPNSLILTNTVPVDHDHKRGQ